MAGPLEIFRFLPKTNCKACGYETCLAFAFALATGAADPEACPELEIEKIRPLLPKDRLPEEDFAWKVLEEVKKKAKALSWKEVAPRLGLEVLSPTEVLIPYLDGLVRLTPEVATREDGLELDPRDQILLYNYLSFAGDEPLSGEFVGLEAFAHSISKVATLRRYAEEKLAETFSSRLKDLKEVLSSGFRVFFLSDTTADLGAEVLVLPKVPLRIHFFEGEPEEGLSAEVKILYDRKATSYLDLESLVFCAERLIERLIEKAKAL